ncbi:DUF2971 domain-containing protein [Chryseobacterium scophthalmum]|uniref:DUF2971 domain-containing protein n=1 Tax=Chryseobacterium scophthalmum TaxID=59733 RepID=UPI003D04E202
MTELLYKYRSLDNFKNFIDIIINNRLYAAKYDDLNDPMEGHYLYKDGILDENMRNKIYDNKQMLRLCSLAKKSDNLLMWSHYSNGHKGVAIGVRIDEVEFEVKDIEYLPNLRYFENTNFLDAVTILSSKINLWEYEQEVRAFTRDGTNFINVIIEEIHIGSKMSHQDYSLIKKLIEKINPTIRIIRNM